MSLHSRHSSLHQAAGDRDEFASVFHASASASSSSGNAGREAIGGKMQLSEDQLYARIEEQLELLDKKRLTLQQLLRSLQDSPYSSRLSRSMESARVDSAKLARKVHNLFRFVALDASKGAADPALLRFQPLFETYALVSQALNNACLESIRFEEEQAKKAPTGGASGLSGQRARASSLADTSRRRQAAAHRGGIGIGVSGSGGGGGGSGSSSGDESRSYSSSGVSSPTLSAQQVGDLQQLESLPLLEVNGLESWESTRRAGDYMHLSSMVSDLASSFRTLRDMTAEQQAAIDAADSNVNRASAQAHAGETDLRQASRYKAFGLVMAGGMTGAAIGGPLGALMGLKTGLSMGVGVGLIGGAGALLGATAAKQIQRARFVPLSHMEEEGHEMTDRQRRESESTDAPPSAASTRSSSSVQSADSSPSHRSKGCRA